jgi:WD40 repeat protein
LALNTSSKKVFAGKNFYQLKREWKAALTEKYAKEKLQLEAQGLTPLSEIKTIKDGTLSLPTLSRDGKRLLYVQQDYFNRPRVHLLNLGTGEDTKISKEIGNQYSFSPDGKKVAFSRIATHKRWYRYFDLYELDLESKSSKRLTKGERAFHPDYSPDGKKIVYVANKLLTTQLFTWDLVEEKATALTPPEKAVQHSNPRFSPDGKQVAVSRWKQGNRDILLLDLQGHVVKQITDDAAIDNHPSFSADGKSLFFSSDRSGVSNIYRYDIASGSQEKISNVLTGLFEPQLRDGKIFVKNYNGHGYDIQTLDYSERPISPAPATTATLPVRQAGVEETPLFKDLDPAQVPEGEIAPKKYNPFKKLFIPRSITPGFFFTDDTAIVSANIGSRDPLVRHVWNAGATYRFDANFLGGNFLYSYNRFWPTIFTSFNDFVVSYGDLFDTGSEFFEERTVASVGASISGYAKGQHALTGYYYFENRSAEGFVPPGAVDVPTLGHMSGFGLLYQFNRAIQNPGDISLTEGPRLILNLQSSDSALGASQNMEQLIFQGDLREYIPLPLKGHVLAFRAAGGIAFGDQFLQGTFRLGSSTGESAISGPTPRLFTLRGLPQITFAGERALLFSGEYRLPLVYPQKGGGTTPLFLQRLHLAFFADYGSVFDGDLDFNNFLLGVGTELRADLILGYALPLTARLGYAIIVSGRQFIQGLTDPITGAALSNGTVILDLGTSF